MSPDPKSPREIRAATPGPGAEELRTAYLELLKLCLCDLAGVQTKSVLMRLEGGVVARETTEEDMQLRAVGKHWPLHGMSMAGLKRLDDLQHCVESVVADGVEGDVIEAGVWRGGASALMRATLDSLGDERLVWLADSFQGFPRPDAERLASERGLDLSGLDFLAASLDEVQANLNRLGLDRGVRWVPGFFEETMPGLRGRGWAIVRLDGDTYDSTRAAIDALYPTLSAGGYLIVDDYQLVPECRRAVDEYRTEHGIDEPIEIVDWVCVRWRRGSEPEAATDAAEPSLPEASPEAVERGPTRPVPSERELELQAQLAVLHERVTTSDSEAPTERELELEREVAVLTDRLRHAELDMAMLRDARAGDRD